MLIKDIVEDTFYGSKCTKDCSGHKAGYRWAKKTKSSTPCRTKSPSFNKGCKIAARQRNSKKSYQGRWTGRQQPKRR